jgi:hypothetical protein
MVGDGYLVVYIAIILNWPVFCTDLPNELLK